MHKWKYHLEDEGIELRRLIDEEDKYAEIIEYLQKCCEILKLKLDKDDDIYLSDLEELTDLMDGEAETLRNNPSEIEDWGFEDESALVDSRLFEFYEICDNCRCWIGI